MLTVTPRILGTDGKKMSKSLSNTILPSDDAQTTQTNVRKMLTDPARVRRTDPGDPHKCSVYDLHVAYNAPDAQITCYNECVNALRGCRDCKDEVSVCISKNYAGYTERKESFDDDKIREILLDGSAKARRIASETITEVKDLMGLTF